MKLLRIKITDPKGFRSLASGFEYHFRTEWKMQEDLANSDFEPFVCAGRNGSGKSNLLEALASIFFQLEVQRIRRNFLPESFDEVTEYAPDGFELEYLMPLGIHSDRKISVPVMISKKPGQPPEIQWVDTTGSVFREADEAEREFLLPAYILGYSSGENEILSLPFFKMRFVQFDEYWGCLRNLHPYSGRPDARMAYLDREFSQAILLSNLLFQTSEVVAAYAGDIGLQAITSFRIILKQRAYLSPDQQYEFGPAVPNAGNLNEMAEQHPHLDTDHNDPLGDSTYAKVLVLLRTTVEALKRCATCWSTDENSDTLTLDYWVNEATSDAFRANFGSALQLFQSLQVFLNLNLYSVSDELKADLYISSSHYANETIPVLPSNERIMRFKEFYVSKDGVEQPLLLKELSDGEHQLLHSLGLCMLFRGTRSLFLLDEPETHFNPDWRAQFISRLRRCLSLEGFDETDFVCMPEMLITTHTPFLISDSKPDKVLIFKKEDSGEVTINHPDYNTLGASINKITMKTFEKTDTVGGVASSMIQAFRKRFETGEDPATLIDEIDQQLGDSVEKLLLIKAILGRVEPLS